MHVLSGVVKDVVLGTLTEARINDAVKQREAMLGEHGRPLPVKPGKAQQVRLTFEAALSRVGGQLSTSSGEYRFSRVLDPSKKVKAQTCIALCSPFGLYALKCVEQHLQPTAYMTLNSLLSACGLLWMKEIPVETIPMIEALVIERICNVELYLPEVERDIKLHELQHLVDGIKEWGESCILSCMCFTAHVFSGASKCVMPFCVHALVYCPVHLSKSYSLHSL